MKLKIPESIEISGFSVFYATYKNSGVMSDNSLRGYVACFIK